MDERNKVIKGITGHVLLSKAERTQIADNFHAEENAFDAKTIEFIDYLFVAYGLKEVIVADT